MSLSNNIEKQQESTNDAKESSSPLTSDEVIEEIEKGLFDAVKTPIKRFYVNIKNDSLKIWTICANIESNNVPIVMVHGFCGGIALWIQNIDAIAENHPFYAFDLLGFGRSSRPPFSSDAKEAENQFVNSIEEWRKEMNLEQIILIGHSFGGFLATAYALKYPIYLKGLILVDSWGWIEKPTSSTNNDTKRALWLKAVGKIPNVINPIDIFRMSGNVGITIFKHVRPTYRKNFMNKIDDTDLVYRYIYYANNSNPTGEIAFRIMSDNYYYAKHPMINRIDKIAEYLPIWFIHGNRSFIESSSSYHAQNKLIKNKVYIKIIDGADHHVYASKADEFNDYIRSIINDIKYETKIYTVID